MSRRRQAGPANSQSAVPDASAVTFRFANLGPVREASLRPGRLTVVAGRNNTGKTYIAHMLFGFLQGPAHGACATRRGRRACRGRRGRGPGLRGGGGRAATAWCIAAIGLSGIESRWPPSSAWRTSSCSNRTRTAKTSRRPDRRKRTVLLRLRRTARELPGSGDPG